MDFEPEFTRTPASDAPDFAQPPARQPLELLRNTEAMLRHQTVETLVPVLPAALAERLQEASIVADSSLDELAEIKLDEISDEELKPARILVALTFIGFGALALLWLMLYLNNRHPGLSLVEQMRDYWYQYICFVCLGVAGMLMLGRESLRPTPRLSQTSDESRADL